MHESERMMQSLREVHSGRPWHGPSLKAILKGVSPKDASNRIGEVHTIWELMLHMSGWMEVVVQRLQGEIVHEPTDGDYPPMPEPTDANWRATIRRYDSSLKKLQKAIAQVKPIDWNRKKPGRRYSYGEMIHGALWHNLYHTGQIGLLKRALRSK